MNAPKTLGALNLILIFMIIPVAACFTHGQRGFLIAGHNLLPSGGDPWNRNLVRLLASVKQPGPVLQIVLKGKSTAG